MKQDNTTQGITGADASGVPSCCGGWAFQQPNITAMHVDYFGRNIIDTTTSLVVERNCKLLRQIASGSNGSQEGFEVSAFAEIYLSKIKSQDL
ncbi:hypothetical protein Pelo_18701 [Pelomyxa schiedti]|nr:hypothetical protein Pelo_18701 [Pelomyxa schiedti]